MQKKEKVTRRKPSIRQKFFHRPNRRRSRTSQISTSGEQRGAEEAQQITRISSAIRAITSIFRKRKEKPPIRYVINEEPTDSSNKNTSVDVLNVNTELESKSVSDADVTFAEKDVDTNLDLYFFEGSESKTVLVATTQISSSDWTELVKILSSEKNIKYLASKTRDKENECELEILESAKPSALMDKQAALDVITQYSRQSIENKAVNTSSSDFVDNKDSKDKLRNLEMTQIGTVSVTPIMNFSTAIQTDPCNLSLLNGKKIIQPKDASTETHQNLEYERTKNAFTATTELNESSSCYEEYRRSLKHTGTECHLNTPSLPHNNNLSAINLVYRLDCINRETIGDNVYLLPVTKSFRKEIDEALDLLKSSEDKLRRLNYIKDHHQMIKSDEKGRLTKPSEYCDSLMNMSEEFRNVTSKIAARYLEEYSGRYDELENYNFYLMKPRAFDMLSIEVDPRVKDVIDDDETVDGSLHKEIVTLEKLIEEITNLENKIKERDCLYQNIHLVRKDSTLINKAGNSKPESSVEVKNCQPNESSEVSKPLNKNTKKLYSHSDNMSKENRMYQKRQFSNSSSVPNLSEEEVDKTIKLLETTRKDLLKFVCNDKRFKQTNKFARRNQTIDFPPQENQRDDFLKRPQKKVLGTNQKNTFVTEECCFYEEHLPMKTIRDETTNNCPKIDKIDKEFLERYTHHKLQVLETLTKAISNLKNSFDEQFSLLKNQSSNTSASSSCSRNQPEGFIKNIINDMITSISAPSTKHTIKHHTTQTEPTESQRYPTSFHSKETLGHVIIEEMIVCDSNNNKQTQISIETTSEREISTKNTNLEDCPCKYVDSLDDLSAEFDRCARREKTSNLSCLSMNAASTSRQIFSDEEIFFLETVNE